MPLCYNIFRTSKGVFALVDIIYARFMEFVDVPQKGKGSIKTSNFTVQYVDYDEETTKRLLEEASHYEVCNHEVYDHYDDVYNTEDHVITRHGKQVDQLISISSMRCFSDEPQVDCLIVDGHFAGVVILVEEIGGNSWNTYHYNYYSILYTDGRIVGTNKYSYCFTGEDSSREETRTYTLHKIK